MRAIDFACRFLTKLAEDDLPPATRHVLVAVAAGLEEKEDIARETGMSIGSCHTLLQALQKRGLLHRIGGSVYRLSPAGKERIRRLLTFFAGSTTRT